MKNLILKEIERELTLLDRIIIIVFMRTFKKVYKKGIQKGINAIL